MKVNIKYISFPLLASIFILIWMNSGVYSLVKSRIPAVIPYGVFFALITILMAKNSDYRIQWKKICLPIVLFYGITLLNYHLLGNHELDPQPLMYLVIVISVAIHCMEMEKREQKIVLVILLLDYLYIGINSWNVLTVYPELSRFLAAGPEKIQKYTEQGFIATGFNITTVGSYGFFYASCYLCMVHFYAALHERRKYLRILFICLTFALLLLIIKGSFTTALLMSVVGLVLQIRSNNSKTNLILFIVIIVIVLFIVICGGIPRLISFISEMEFLSDATRFRFQEMYTTLVFGTRDASSIFSRIELYKNSFMAFIYNPFGGYMCSGWSSIGQHSSFLDYFGMYGLFASVLLLGIIRYAKLTIWYVQSKGKAMKTIWLTLLLTSFINPILNQNIYVSVCVFCVLFLNRIVKK